MNSDPQKPAAPPMPTRPVMPPPEAAKPRGSIWSIIIAGATALALFIGLFFLAGALGPIVLGVGLVLGAIYLIACLHYLLWGRWLGDAIRQEVEEEERHARERDSRY
jgi:hypothetical protein